MRSLPVIAAIPNYNMPDQLAELLPQVVASGYDDVYVLDDASEKVDASLAAANAIDSSIQFVMGAENRGAGGNRNRIFDHISREAIIHFMDADCTLETTAPALAIAEVMPDDPIGFMGGLVLTPEGRQSVWNYGPRQSAFSDLGANVQNIAAQLMNKDADKAERWLSHFGPLMQDWPDPFSEPEPRQVFWAIESNLIINSEIFRQVGGFDPRLREHEIQDLAIRMAKLGLPRYFDPSIAVTQTPVDVRHYNRLWAQLKAEAHIQRQYGLRNWALPNRRLRPKL